MIDVLCRTAGWAFLMAGGALYNKLDYSFTTKHPDGALLDYRSPGGGNPTFRKEIKVLKGFVGSFAFVRTQPLRGVVTAPKDAAVEALVEPGKQYAVYLYALLATGFSARWPGRLVPEASGAYRLTTVSDDGVRLYVDGRRTIDDWTDHGTTDDHATVELTAGKPVALKLEYYQGGGGTARLRWTLPDGASEVIPTSRLKQPDGLARGAKAEYFDGRSLDASPTLVRADATIDSEWPAGQGPVEAKPRAAAPVDVGLEMPSGRYRAEWIDPKKGAVAKAENLEHAGGRRTLVSAPIGEDSALALRAR